MEEQLHQSQGGASGSGMEPMGGGRVKPPGSRSIYSEGRNFRRGGTAPEMQDRDQQESSCTDCCAPNSGTAHPPLHYPFTGVSLGQVGRKPTGKKLVSYCMCQPLSSVPVTRQGTANTC